MVLFRHVLLEVSNLDILTLDISILCII